MNIDEKEASTMCRGDFDFETIKKSVASRVPPHTVEQNMNALQIGFDAV